MNPQSAYQPHSVPYFLTISWSLQQPHFPCYGVLRLENWVPSKLVPGTKIWAILLDKDIIERGTVKGRERSREVGECRREELGFLLAWFCCWLHLPASLSDPSKSCKRGSMQWVIPPSQLMQFGPDFTNWFLSPWIWGTNVFLATFASWEGKWTVANQNTIMLAL